MAKECRKEFQVALLLKTKGHYCRGVIEGACGYFHSTRLRWKLLLGDHFYDNPDLLADWKGDGVIADFDDPNLLNQFASNSLPVVGVGGSWLIGDQRVAHRPLATSDNASIIHAAYMHLIDMGLLNFACLTIVATPGTRWAQEREFAFRKLTQADGHTPYVFEASPSYTGDSGDNQQALCNWLIDLPKPVGIIAVTDLRAQQLLHACEMTGLCVPEEVAVIGVNDDPLLQVLGRIPMSSVAQRSQDMGWQAGQMLHKLLLSHEPYAPHVLIPPLGVSARESSRHTPLSSPYVQKARHYIRQFAPLGIKAEQVAVHVGVSRTTIDQYFTRELGRTVHEDLLAHRLCLAQAMLKDSTFGCVEIAKRCGFVSAQYLSSVFRRELGCTPNEYRYRASDPGYAM